MALHEQSVGKTSEWYTPKYVFDALGCTFTMDVASPNPPVRWVPTSRHLWERSLEQTWDGFVWMNPPFGGRNGLEPWLEKFYAHENGVALVPDRTSAPWWQRFAPSADLILFVAKKIKFIDASGNPGRSPAQGTCLLALGAEGKRALRNAAAAHLGSLFEPGRRSS